MIDYEADEDDEVFNPLVRGAAAPPGVIGGGCLARFDPEDLNDASGVDFPFLHAPISNNSPS